MKQKIAIIGAGPAGLTAAYLLAKAGQEVIVFEADAHYVGGISRTEEYKGYLFDIGGHRFFSKSKEVEDFWKEILSDDMLIRPRSSRVYYSNKFFSYPLVALDALKKLGFVESTRCVLSYIKAKLFPIRNVISFEDWVTNQFGKRLFLIFFKTYTEKVWGIKCSEISSEWAAQRIKGLSLSTAIRNAILPPKQKQEKGVIKTLINSFMYPRRGPGMMWETCAEKFVGFGGSIYKNAKVEKIILDNNKWVIHSIKGEIHEGFDHVISSMPLRELALSLYPEFAVKALDAALQLRYRDFISIILIMKDTNKFSDNWIYIHDASVKVGRIQNFKSWSPEMVPDSSMVCYGLEYFCFEGDGLWTSSDQALIELAKTEIEKIGIAEKAEITDGYVVRQKKAYPVYDQSYKNNMSLIKKELNKYNGLHVIGRNGMHKYNNQDHSIMTAMLAVKNILARRPLYDLWKVNEDAEYHETINEHEEKKAGRMIPQKISWA